MQRLGNFPTPEVSGEVAERQAGPVAAPIGYLNPKVLGPDGKIAATDALTHSGVPVGGWTMPIYTAPPSPLTEQDKDDAERYQCLKEMASGGPNEGSYFFPGIDAWGGDVPMDPLSIDQAVDAIRAARAKKEQP